MMLLIICFSGILMAGRQSYNNIIQFLSGGMYQKKKGFKKPAHADITTKMYKYHLFFKKFVAEKSSYVVSRVLKIQRL